tara:strand:+ start:1041 stop:1565 length:525 start_codon:yes stop_codon:yes gene_type:complete
MRIIIISLILIFNFLNFAKIQAETNITYVDLEKVMSQSLVGKYINDQLITIQKNDKKNITANEKKLQEQEKLIRSQKNVLEKNEFNNKVLSFKKEVNNHNKKKSQLVRELNKKRLDATTKLLDNLNPILAKYAKDKSISMVIQKKYIIIGESELDITKDILKLLNEKIKKIDVK